MKYSDKNSKYFNGFRPEMLEFFPDDFKTFIDIGCGSGGTISAIKDIYNAEVWGIEYVEAEAKKAAEVSDKVLSGSVEENIDKLPDNYFDVISCFDVLEHLTYPEDVLIRLRGKLKSDGVLISSIPNVRHFSNMYNLLVRRDWMYEESGILDYTHLRFFTSKSILRMYSNSGYKVLTHKGINPARWWKYMIINLLTLGIFSDGRYIQFATVATAKSESTSKQ